MLIILLRAQREFKLHEYWQSVKGCFSSNLNILSSHIDQAVLHLFLHNFLNLSMDI